MSNTISTPCGKELDSRGYASHKRKCRICGETDEKTHSGAREKDSPSTQHEIEEKSYSREAQKPAQHEKGEIVEPSRGKDSPSTQHETSEPSKNLEKERGKDSPASDSETGEPQENIIYGALAAILAILVAAIGILYLWWKGKEGKTNA